MIEVLAVVIGFSIVALVLYMGEKKIRVNGKKIDKEIEKLLGEGK